MQGDCSPETGPPESHPQVSPPGWASAGDHSAHFHGVLLAQLHAVCSEPVIVAIERPASNALKHECCMGTVGASGC